MNRTGTLFIAALITLQTGCMSSPAIRFHTLVPPPQQQQTMEPAPAVRVMVDRVFVPAQVDRSELVIRQGQTGLTVLSSDWWGASLSEEIRTALEARFSRPANDLPAVTVQVQVLRFDSVPGQHAWLEARYQLTDRKGNKQACTTRLSRPASEDLDSLVLAQQGNVQELAGEIQMSAERLVGNGRGLKVCVSQAIN